MKSLAINLLTIATVVFATNAQASGFRCEDTQDLGYSVKLYNKTSGGTRIPSKLILSQESASPRTLLVAGQDEITKHNRLNTVQYVVDGNEKVGAERVILQITFKEGAESLEAGEHAPGQLIFVSEDGDRDVVRLTCERYLKGE